MGVTQTEVSMGDILRDERDTETLVITVKGKETVWEYKALSWFEKTQCFSKAVKIEREGENVGFGFDFAMYYLEALRFMLVKGPVPIIPEMLKSLSNEIGQALEKIVPVPFDDVLDAAKKE